MGERNALAKRRGWLEFRVVVGLELCCALCCDLAAKSGVKLVCGAVAPITHTHARIQSRLEAERATTGHERWRQGSRYRCHHADPACLYRPFYAALLIEDMRHATSNSSTHFTYGIWLSFSATLAAASTRTERPPSFTGSQPQNSALLSRQTAPTFKMLHRTSHTLLNNHRP